MYEIWLKKLQSLSYNICIQSSGNKSKDYSNSVNYIEVLFWRGTGFRKGYKKPTFDTGRLILTCT